MGAVGEVQAGHRGRSHEVEAQGVLAGLRALEQDRHRVAPARHLGCILQVEAVPLDEGALHVLQHQPRHAGIRIGVEVAVAHRYRGRPLLLQVAQQH